MQFISTPTTPSQIAPGSMLDIAELPEEYATFVGFDGSYSDNSVAFLTVLHKGELVSLVVPADANLSVVTYDVSNALETR
jgi:hypothetical protein